jgi:hypothetical protein
MKDRERKKEKVLIPPYYNILIKNFLTKNGCELPPLP